MRSSTATRRPPALSIAAAANFAGQPVFWTLPPRFLTGARAAAGFAAINSVGNLGGLIAQTTVPAIHDRTDSNLAPILFLAVCLAATAIGVLVLARRLPPGRQRRPLYDLPPSPSLTTLLPTGH